MEFSYAEYYYNCYTKPRNYMIFLVAWVILFLVSVIYYLAKNRSLVQLLRTKGLTVVFCLVLVPFFIAMNYGRLANGGTHLRTEQEIDAVLSIGRIEFIEPMTRFEFPEIDSKYESEDRNGVYITIDNVKYKAFASGIFTPGDIVEIAYLPKSKYILTINGTGDGLPISSGEPDIPTD